MQMFTFIMTIGCDTLVTCEGKVAKLSASSKGYTYQVVLTQLQLQPTDEF